MDAAVRFILRFLIVPVGMVAAGLAAALVASVAHGQKFLALVNADPDATGNLLATVILVGSALELILSIAVVAMLLPALVGILIAEAFAIRSWIFHALNGGLSVWIGWAAMAEFRKPYEFYDEPMIMIGAGLAAGFAYWAIAGWNAGFWKPVFRRVAAPATLR